MFKYPKDGQETVKMSKTLNTTKHGDKQAKDAKDI